MRSITTTVPDTISSTAIGTSPKLQRHSLFSKTNIIREKFTSPSRVWTKLLPPITQISARGIDVSTTFTSPDVGASKLVEICGIQHSQKVAAYEQLQYCLRLFSKLVPEGSTCRARIVSSRGAPGVKCPRWHIDHVPLRLISALEGPGACYLDGDVDWDNVNGSDEVDTKQANKDILSSHAVKERRSRTGDVLVLLGKEWEGEDVKAVVHKSPELRPFEGRVLLAVDVVV